jgi:predicted ABC-type ATPase
MGRDMSKQVLILAGPNGAGKTTFAREFLTTEANCPTFLNADIVAAELSPQHPEQVAMRAARFMLQGIREEVANGESFAFVLQGGHNIPEEVVRRRFLAGRVNFDDLYRGLVDSWVLYDNSDAVPVLLDWGEKR